jgi:hypothetical protein
VNEQPLIEILDQTIRAFSLLDLNRLETLERQIHELAGSRLSSDRAGMNLIRARRDMLEGVLHNSASNLNALNCLYERDVRDPWERSAR